MSDSIVSAGISLLAKRWKPIAAGVAVGTAIGAGATIAYGLATGRIPMWFGPERARWSAQGWDDAEARLITALSSATGSVRDHGMHSTRNFVYCGANPERRIRAQYFFFPSERKLTGVAHFGADCEGPPRCVHGGAIAALADSALGKCAHHCGFKCVTVNLNVNYRRFIALGSGILMESFFEREEGRKIYLRFLFRSLDGLTTHAEGTALFLKVNTTGVPTKSAPPPAAAAATANATPSLSSSTLRSPHASSSTVTTSSSPVPATPTRTDSSTSGYDGASPLLPITPATPLSNQPSSSVPNTPLGASISSSSATRPHATPAAAAAASSSTILSSSGILDDGVLVDAPHVTITQSSSSSSSFT